MAPALITEWLPSVYLLVSGATRISPRQCAVGRQKPLSKNRLLTADHITLRVMV